jgi:hypothetical protein
MDPKIVEALADVFTYAAHVDEWKVINRELLKTLPAPLRKEVNINRYELARRWSEMSGRPVVFSRDEAPQGTSGPT